MCDGNWGKEATGAAGVECGKTHPALRHRREGFLSIASGPGGGGETGGRLGWVGRVGERGRQWQTTRRSTEAEKRKVDNLETKLHMEYY